MTSNSTTPRSTAVYVDGYNLYYGRLRGTPFKWLDLVKLFDELLAQRDQNEKLNRVNLFTAHALSTFASHGDASVEAQSAYHRALQTKYGERFETVYGTHSFDRSGTLLPVYVPDQPFDRTARTRVWKVEEKRLTSILHCACIAMHAKAFTIASFWCQTIVMPNLLSKHYAQTFRISCWALSCQSGQ